MEGGMTRFNMQLTGVPEEKEKEVIAEKMNFTGLNKRILRFN